MVKLTHLLQEDYEVFISVLKVYLHHLKEAEKSSVNLVYMSIAETVELSLNREKKFNISTLNFQYFTKHSATVFCCAILFYLGYPERNQTKDVFLRKIATNIITQLKK